MAQRAVTAHINQVQELVLRRADQENDEVVVLRANVTIPISGQAEGEYVIGQLQFDFDPAVGCPWQAGEDVPLTISI